MAYIFDLKYCLLYQQRAGLANHRMVQVNGSLRSTGNQIRPNDRVGQVFRSLTILVNGRPFPVDDRNDKRLKRQEISPVRGVNSFDVWRFKVQSTFCTIDCQLLPYRACRFRGLCGGDLMLLVLYHVLQLTISCCEIDVTEIS